MVTRSAVRAIVVQPDRRVHAERKVGAGAAVARQRFLGALAHESALLGVQIRRDDPVAEPREAVELRGEQLAAIARGDQDGWTRLVPRQRADGVIVQVHVAAPMGHRLAAPEHPPDLDVLLEAPDASLVIGPARRPFALGGRQAPAHAEAEHHASPRHAVHAGDLVGEHDRVAKRRE